jgi:hypothetical protein
MNEHVERINCARQAIKVLSALRESPSIVDGASEDRNVIDREVTRLWKAVDDAVEDIKMVAIRSIWED